MRKMYLIMAMVALVFTACNSNQVKVRGEVEGLVGNVKLLAEMPGQSGLVVLDEQEVTDGSIDLRTEELQLPARVWVDIDGKATIVTIVDTKDMTWIEGKIKFPTEIEAKGSGLMDEYNNIRKLFKEKYDDVIAPIDRKIERIATSDKMSRDDEVMLGIYQLQKQKYIRNRANWAKQLVEANPAKEVSLFIIKDELADSLAAQKRLFRKMQIENKESNIYKVLQDRLK